MNRRTRPAPRSPYSAMHSGPGRALTAVYGIFALSATARAGYQVIREFDVAPVAYTLSVIAAGIFDADDTLVLLRGFAYPPAPPLLAIRKRGDAACDTLGLV